ncbi:Protein tpx2 [Blyttiomyces sp. JEL0837]|nr:Protein tpx2 [Blyttiomyces sp. JEL0837]
MSSVNSTPKAANNIRNIIESPSKIPQPQFPASASTPTAVKTSSVYSTPLQSVTVDDNDATPKVRKINKLVMKSSLSNTPADAIKKQMIVKAAAAILNKADGDDEQTQQQQPQNEKEENLVVKVATPKQVGRGSGTGGVGAVGLGLGMVMETVATAAERDINFEFSAPKFHDFADQSQNPWDDQADAWFDERLGSPGAASDLVSAFQLSAEDDGEAEQQPKQQNSQQRKGSKKFESQHVDLDTFKITSGMSKLNIRQGSSVSVSAGASSTTRAKSAKGPRPSQSQHLTEKASHGNVTSTSNASNNKPGEASKGPRPLTIPKEFSFLSRPSKNKDKDNKKLLHTKSPAIKKRKHAKRTNELTIPKPFQFRSSFRHHYGNNDARMSCKSPFVPLAVKVKQFETEVPDRFKVEPKPLLQTNSTVQPVDETQISSFDDEIPDQEHVTLTNQRWNFGHFLNFPSEHLTTEERELKSLAPFQHFKARPLDKKPSLTVPMSPHIRKPKPLPPPEPEPPKIIKANPIRFTEVRFEPVIEHRVILPADVKLPGDEIRERKLREIEERRRLEEEMMEKAKVFQARPITKDLNSVDPLPEVLVKPPTEPQPFQLETALRSAFHPIDVHPAGPRPAKPFIAQPVPIFEPFVPKKSTKPPTTCEEVVLHTDIRSDERRAYDEARRLKELAEEEMKEKMRLEKEEQEKLEIRRLRQLAVHQAQPVRKFPPVVIHPSTRKLTEPESPLLKDKRERMFREKIRSAGSGLRREYLNAVANSRGEARGDAEDDGGVDFLDGISAGDESEDGRYEYEEFEGEGGEAVNENAEIVNKGMENAEDDEGEFVVEHAKDVGLSELDPFVVGDASAETADGVGGTLNCESVSGMESEMFSVNFAKQRPLFDDDEENEGELSKHEYWHATESLGEGRGDAESGEGFSNKPLTGAQSMMAMAAEALSWAESPLFARDGEHGN